jgi:hypothetical protein
VAARQALIGMGSGAKNPSLQNPTIPGAVRSSAKGVLGWVLAAVSESQSGTGSLSELGVTSKAASMFFHHNLVTNGKTQTRSFPNRFRCKKGVKDFREYRWINPRTIVGNFNDNVRRRW